MYVLGVNHPSNILQSALYSGHKLKRLIAPTSAGKPWRPIDLVSVDVTTSDDTSDISDTLQVFSSPFEASVAE
jgi:hypothetical protein